MSDAIQMAESYYEEGNNSQEIIHFRPLPQGKSYHVFLSYRDVDGDRQWVQELIEKLQTTYKLKCCNHLTDFRPGRRITENIKDAIISSVKTLIILSKEYHDSHWCVYEAEQTYMLSIELRERIIIPVLKEDCDIPDHMKPFTYIDARGPISQWLPILVSTIEEPVGGAIESKYSRLDFNTRYRNFDIVHVEKTVFRCSVNPSKLPFKPRRFLPDSLSDKVFNLTYEEYRQVLSVISMTFLIRYRHTGQPWLPIILCCVLPALVIIGFLIFIVYSWGLAGNLNEVATQLLQNDIHKQFTVNTTVAEVTNDLTTLRSRAILILILSTLWILLISFYIIRCAVRGTCMKKQSIAKDVRKVNELLIRHNLLAGMTSNCLTGTAKVIFIYFDHLQCLKCLSEYLKSIRHANSNCSHGISDESSIDNFFDGNEENIPLLNIEVNNDNGIGEGELNYDQHGKSDKPSTLNEEDYMVQAMDKFYEAAPDFVWDLVHNKIEYRTNGHHSNRMNCLCEYIIIREEFKRSTAYIKVEYISWRDNI